MERKLNDPNIRKQPFFPRLQPEYDGASACMQSFKSKSISVCHTRWQLLAPAPLRPFSGGFSSEQTQPVGFARIVCGKTREFIRSQRVWKRICFKKLFETECKSSKLSTEAPCDQANPILHDVVQPKRASMANSAGIDSGGRVLS